MENEEARLDRIRERDATWRWGLTAALLIGGALRLRDRRDPDDRAQPRRRDAAERAPKKSSACCRRVFAGIDDGITLLDRRGKLIFANAAAARMIGFDSPAGADGGVRSTELLARFEIVDEEGAPLPPEQLPSRAVFTGSPVARTTIRYRTGRSGALALVDRAGRIRSPTPSGNVIQAINVFRDVTADREADERRRFLLQAVDELNSSLDYERTLAAIARLAVPVLADWCGVDVVEDGRVKRLATAHVDPNKLAAAIAIEKRYPPDPKSKTGVQEIVRTGEAAADPRDSRASS